MTKRVVLDVTDSVLLSGLKMGGTSTAAAPATTAAAAPTLGTAAPLQLGVAKTSVSTGFTLSAPASTAATGLKLGGQFGAAPVNFVLCLLIHAEGMCVCVCVCVCV